MSAITAVTAQSTTGVSAIHHIPPEIVLAQVRAVARDIGVDAVKVGMLGTAETVVAVAQAIDELPTGTPVVVDPVMVAESGARLLEPEAQRAVIEWILPRASVLTPATPKPRTPTQARIRGLAIPAMRSKPLRDSGGSPDASRTWRKLASISGSFGSSSLARS